MYYPSPPHLSSLYSCFVPTTDTQATMTGRSWRHFSVFWPFMLAGAVGPRDQGNPDDALLDGLPVAPTAAASGPPAAPAVAGDEDPYGTATESDCESETGGSVAGAAPGDEVRAVGPLELPGPDVVHTQRYLHVFGSMPIDDAVLDTFCRAARLGGALFGDNVACTTAHTEAEVKAMEAAASALGVDSIQTLYGHINTSKLHRLVQHLGDELRARGNLWEGDTSENERLHSSCKRMFHRSNKRGPTVTLQMIRCDEAQSAVLQDVQEANEDMGGGASDEVGSGGGTDGAPGGVDAVGGSGGVPAQTADLSFSGRARRVPVSALRRTPELVRIADALGADTTAWVTTHNTVRIVARFEWGAPAAVQHLRATHDFAGKPWYSYVRYETSDGGIGWGRIRVVLRSIGAQRRSCVVLQRLRPVAPRAGCVLTRYSCVRLQWDFESSDDEHPALEVVDATRILRSEDVQVDYRDLADRHGLFATLSNSPDTAAERRACRFFTNPFFPWTTRALRPGL